MPIGGSGWLQWTKKVGDRGTNGTPQETLQSVHHFILFVYSFVYQFQQSARWFLPAPVKRFGRCRKKTRARVASRRRRWMLPEQWDINTMARPYPASFCIANCKPGEKQLSVHKLEHLMLMPPAWAAWAAPAAQSPGHGRVVYLI